METLLEILRDPAWEGIVALIAIFALFVKTIKYFIDHKYLFSFLLLMIILGLIGLIIHFDYLDKLIIWFENFNISDDELFGLDER